MLPPACPEISYKAKAGCRELSRTCACSRHSRDGWVPPTRRPSRPPPAVTPGLAAKAAGVEEELFPVEKDALQGIDAMFYFKSSDGREEPPGGEGAARPVLCALQRGGSVEVYRFGRGDAFSRCHSNNNCGG